MKKSTAAILVSFIMIIAVLGITNPVRKQSEMAGYVEGRLTHNYFIFSVYQQSSGYTITENGKYRLYKRYIGIATTFFEIKPLKVKQE
jgi:hypothetical protein